MQIELKRLQHRLGITFVFVTHDQEEALTMSDRIALMNAGRIEQIGTVAEIYHRPATRFVAGFVGHANLLNAEVIGSEHEHIRVKIGGTIEFRVAKTQAAGDVPGTLTLSVRPEKIAVSSERPTDSGCFEATVIEELFRGPLDQLLLRTSVGLELTALVANQGATQQPIHAGDRVWCSIHPDDVILVHDEPPAQK
jgi:spermidine/putrescine transport system ATP-binding protein